MCSIQGQLVMLSFRISIVLLGLLISSSAIAGTILLMGIGLGTPGSGPPPSCSNSLDFTEQCNSQYVGTF